MVATLLLAKVDNQIRRQDVGRIVLQCLHGIHAIERSLSVFHSIVTDSHRDIQPSLDVGGVFDAHVGDCACHMRAQMLWDLTRSFANSEKIQLLKDAIALLNELKINAAFFVQLLSKKNGNLTGLGFGSKILILDIFDYIGFTRFLDLAKRQTSVSEASTPPTPATPLSIHFGESGPPSPLTINALEAVENNQSKSECRYSSDSSTTSNSTYSSTSSRSHRSLTVDIEWNTDDFLTVMRFLTITHVLSCSKKAILEPGPPARVIGRVDPLISYTKSEEELDALKLIGDFRLSSIIRPTDRVGKKNSLVRECETMQIYIAQLTTDWTKKLADRVCFSPPTRRLLHGFAVTSSRQISCVSSYLSIMLIRAAWMKLGTPILVVIQRFCSYGYHNIFHRVTARHGLWDLPEVAQDFTAMGECNWFDVVPVSHEKVISSSWSGEPHIILFCISGPHSSEQFYGRLVDGNQELLGSHEPHLDEQCHEVDEYSRLISEVNFSRLIMHFFAQHEQFPSTLPDGNRDGSEYVASWLERQLGEKSRQTFVNAVEEAETFGTRRFVSLYSPQHVYLELPGVVGRQLKDMLSQKKKPGLMGYRWDN